MKESEFLAGLKQNRDTKSEVEEELPAAATEIILLLNSLWFGEGPRWREFKEVSSEEEENFSELKDNRITSAIEQLKIYIKNISM